MPDKPSPCPFCGSESIMAEGQPWRLAMVCQMCLARGPEIGGDSRDYGRDHVEERKAAAVAAWNARVVKS